MMRSLYAGVSGLKTHQIKMDVIGNNIANVNTVAYKSSSITFSELMYQTSQNASGPNAATGRAGINPKQIGLGVKSGAISTAIEAAGASQNTGNPFDVQINGNSFFIVSDGSSNYFTRAGAFNVDVNGTLCMTTNGYTVQGWEAQDDGSINKNNVGPLQIMSTKTMSSNPEATTKGYLTGIIDKNDSQLATGQVATISIYDAQGYSYTVKFSVTSTANQGEYTLKCTDILDSKTKSIFVDTSGNPLSAVDRQTKIDGLNLFNGKDAITVTYDTVKGALQSVDGAATATGFTFNATSLATINNAFSTNIDVDLSTTKNIDNKGTSTITGQAGTLANKAVGAGRTTGEMDSLAIQTDGKIVATYTNGVTKTLGQIAVANFANPAGLKKEGENLYSATMNSGEFNGIGEDITADGGGFSTGVLEMSNVDLSSEFTEMITTQRGFQANSRIITVSDTMIEELVNLKR